MGLGHALGAGMAWNRLPGRGHVPERRGACCKGGACPGGAGKVIGHGLGAGRIVGVS